MARASLTVQEERAIPESGVTLDWQAVDPTNGTRVPNDGRTILRVRADWDATLRLTCHVRGVVHRRDITLAAGQQAEIGPFSKELWNRHPFYDGHVYVDQVGGYFGDLWVAAIRQQRVAIDGYPWALEGASPPPGYGDTLAYWFDGDDLDGKANATLVDGSPFGSPVNKGVQGGVFAPLGTSPTYREVLAAGKCGDRAGLQWSDTAGGIAVSGSNIPQPTSIFVLAQVDRVGSGYFVDSVNSARRNALLWSATLDEMQAYAGVTIGFAPAPVVGEASLYGAIFAGAASYGEKDGAGQVVNAGQQSLEGLTIAARFNNSNRVAMRIWQVLAWSSPPNLDAVRAWFASRFGTTPQ